MTKLPPKPKLGQTIMAHGKPCVIYRIYPGFTIDVESPDGQCYRLTGLAWQV